MTIKQGRWFGLGLMFALGAASASAQTVFPALLNMSRKPAPAAEQPAVVRVGLSESARLPSGAEPIAAPAAAPKVAAPSLLAAPSAGPTAPDASPAAAAPVVIEDCAFEDEHWGPALPEDINLFGESCFLRDNRLRVYGWGDFGYTYSSNGSGLLTVEPRPNRFGNEFLANQLAVVIERELDPEKLSFGFNVTYLAGADAALLQPKNGIDDPPSDPRFSNDFRQLYVSAHLPVLTECGVDVKVGRMNSLLDYNASLAPYRPLYSNDYQWFYSQDNAFTGAVFNVHVNKQLDVLSGVTLGANTFFEKRSKNSYCYIGQVNYWLTEEKKTLLSASMEMGENAILAAPGRAGNFAHVFELHVQRCWSQYLDQIVQGNIGWDADIPGAGSATFWGVYNLFSAHASCTLDVNFRAEYYRDEKGTRTGFDAHYSELTLGLDYHPRKFIRIRPELRTDFADTRAFDGGTKHSQFTAAIDWLFQF